MEASNQQLTPSGQIHCLFRTLVLEEQLSLIKTLQEEHKTLHNSKKRKIYDEKIKEDAVEKFKAYGSATKAAEYINNTYEGSAIDESYVRRWIETALEEKEIKQIKKKFKLSRGPTPFYPELEVILIKWFTKQRQKKLAVTLKMFRSQALTIFASLRKKYEESKSSDEKMKYKIYGENKFTASSGWFKRFKVRNNISKRISTHIASSLSETYSKEIAKFLLDVKRIRYCLLKFI